MGTPLLPEQLGHARSLQDLRTVSGRLNVHRNTVRRLVNDGHLKAVRVGVRVMFDPAEVDRFIAEGGAK